MQKKAIIIGAGPAGLTAAYELLKRTDIKPIVIEKCSLVGGISKTIDYKGNKMDFGPHRFFSKSDRVMNWWTNIMPLHSPKGEDLTLTYQNKSRTIDTSDYQTTEPANGKPPARSMLVIERLTRIYFLRKFFAYPIQLSIATLGQLGIFTTIKIVFSYLYARLFPRKPQNSLEDFMINKFGSVLYHIFFKDYTEKVWGMECSKISADWGAQRIKGVSLSKAILHAAKSLAKKKKNDIHQKDTETSLIEQFLYPAMGAGAMWEEVARQVEVLGGRIATGYEVQSIITLDNTITAIDALNVLTGQVERLEGDYFFSTMPIKELIGGLQAEVPPEVKKVAEGLIYRDFVYAGVLVKNMAIETPKDSWIYIQEKDVKVARIQVYNNWGPYMVADPETVWLGLEYFCTKGDAIWNMTDEAIQQLAIAELVKMNLISAESVLDSTVNRMEKTYPAYFGTYDRFNLITEYLETFPNLFLVGRNGMHKYNNTDHSMLTAMVAVDNICAGVTSKVNLWEINTEQEYHEEKQSETAQKHAFPSAIPTVKGSFNRFVWIQHKWILLLSLVLLVTQFLILKYIYPFANFIPDSYSYIEAAWNNTDINIWPIGYSKFLRIFSAFLHSDKALILFQYLLLEGAALYFLFSFCYWVSNNKVIKYALLLVIVVNPAFLHLANFITADAVFTSLSIIWLTQVMWIIYKPSWRLLVSHGLLIGVLFMIRYNALYFPVITIAVLLISQCEWRKKLATVVVAGALIFAFVWHTENKYEQITGVRQFSPFGGWQMANNALYMYSHINNAGGEIEVPEKFAEINRLSLQHFDSLNKIQLRPDTSIGIYYLWNDQAPLKVFMYKQKMDSTKGYLGQWASVAPMYYDFGKYLIANNLSDYFKYYLLQNIINFYLPQPEFMAVYNMGQDSVGTLAKNWFGYKTLKVPNIAKKKEIKIIDVYKPIVAAVNAGFALTLIGFLMFGGLKQSPPALRKLILLFTLLYGVNFLFSILASPIVMRYQLFLLIPLLTFSIYQAQFLLKSEK